MHGAVHLHTHAHTWAHMCTHTYPTCTLREETGKAHKGSATVPKVSLGGLWKLSGDPVRDEGDPQRIPDSQGARLEGASGKEMVFGKPK